ncbi:vertebrae development associated [Phyllostomus discolor]|nr:vertnin isoform X2 [Phyllostomus discolor]XP_035868020.1 vertnin isoform X2 [Phyllostomus discolor]KAF6133701.1 vertebrae development associated [Phyllostomus discolor]
MTPREQLIQQVLQELQEAVESEGLEGLVGAALEAKQVLSSFTLPTCREKGPSRQVLEVDSVALSLYPEDAPRNMLPLVCKGEGSLLFEAASTLLWGDAGLSLELRARTVVEMLLHRHYYLQGMIDSKVMLQAVRYSLCSEESPEMTSLPSATLEAIFDADVKATCFPSSFSNVWHLYALASILQRNIYSIYPMRNLKIRPYFNRIIRPRRCDHMPATLHIMWAGQPLTSHLFRHQYFAPVVGLEEVEAEDATSLALPPLAPAALPPSAKTPELFNQDPGRSYSQLCERYSVTKNTFYRWRRQSQEHQQKVATLYSAKHVLQESVRRGGIMSLQQFLQRFPEISRSTYYAWKNELLGTGAGQPLTPKEGTEDLEQVEKLPEEQVAKGLGCSVLAEASPAVVLMQRAKLYLEHCISLNTLVPYRCFKRRFPSISRSTYYNWRRKALRRNPSFKPAPALSVGPAPQLASVGEEALLPEKSEVGEKGTGKATDGGLPAPRPFVPPRMPLSRWQRRLRRAARKQVLSGHLPFCRFRLRYPSLSPSAFWVWKSLARGWPRSLSRLQMQVPALGKGGVQESEGKREKQAGKNVLVSVAPAAGAPKVAASPGEDPEKAQGGPSREKVLQEGATAQGRPPSGSWSSPSVAKAAAAGSRDSQVLMMDMLASTKFKAQAKLFLQKCFQSKSFPSYKEFSALFPLTARSTYYMWKRALYDGLTLVDG